MVGDELLKNMCGFVASVCPCSLSRAFLLVGLVADSPS